MDYNMTVKVRGKADRHQKISLASPAAAKDYVFRNIMSVMRGYDLEQDNYLAWYRFPFCQDDLETDTSGTVHGQATAVFAYAYCADELVVRKDIIVDITATPGTQ